VYVCDIGPKKLFPFHLCCHHSLNLGPQCSGWLVLELLIQGQPQDSGEAQEKEVSYNKGPGQEAQHAMQAHVERYQGGQEAENSSEGKVQATAFTEVTGFPEESKTGQSEQVRIDWYELCRL
jgi:hypothetical protein